MPKPLRIVLWGFGGLLFAVLAFAAALYLAAQRAPEFYRRAVEATPSQQRTANDQMLQRATALASDLRKEGRWEAVFTAEQINGWLAVDLVRNHRDLLPAAVMDPRVAIGPGEFSIACRYSEGRVETVLSLTADVYLHEPNVIGVRLRKVRAGWLPLSQEEVHKQISQAAERLDLPIEWRQADGDPVALVTLPPPRDRRQRAVRIETLKLGQGEIYLAGTTHPGSR